MFCRSTAGYPSSSNAFGCGSFILPTRKMPATRTMQGSTPCQSYFQQPSPDQLRRDHSVHQNAPRSDTPLFERTGRYYHLCVHGVSLNLNMLIFNPTLPLVWTGKSMGRYLRYTGGGVGQSMNPPHHPLAQNKACLAPVQESDKTCLSLLRNRACFEQCVSHALNQQSKWHNIIQ